MNASGFFRKISHETFILSNYQTNVGRCPTTHRDSSLTGEMNSPYSLVPHAAVPRTAHSRCVSNRRTQNNLFFIVVVSPSVTNIVNN